MPEGMKGKSFIERGVTPMEERYIGNAKMFSEDEKQQLFHVYKNELNYTDITKPLYEESEGMIQLIGCSILIFIHGCEAISY